MLLNSHLGPQDDQLPLTGPDADGFGPRTEAKVKRFQQANHIDFGTKYYMDGVVGEHTWEKLNERQEVVVKIVTVPLPQFKPPPPPIFTPSRPPSVTVDAPPKLHLDSVQVQASGQQTIFTGKNADSPSTSEQIQAVLVFLKKNDGLHVDGQVGGAVQAGQCDSPKNKDGSPNNQCGPTNQAGGPTNQGNPDKADLGVLFILEAANLPGSGKRITWSVQDQTILWKSLTNPTWFIQKEGILNFTLNVLKRKDKSDLFQVNSYLGGLLEADSPDPSAGKRFWTIRGGVLFGLGATISF